MNNSRLKIALLAGLIFLILFNQNILANEQLILLNFQNANIDQVLDFYSKLTDLTVVKDEGVKGLITIINPTQLPKDRAIKAIEAAIEIKGFSMVKEEDIIRVFSKTEIAYQHRVFHLQNARAKKVAEVLSRLSGAMMPEQEQVLKARVIAPASSEKVAYLKGEIKVVADERTNSLIITTLPENFPTIEELIERLDIRTPQVLIEALIAEVTLDDRTKFGLDFKWIESSAEKTGTLRMGWEGLKQDSTDPARSLHGLSYWFLKENLSLEGLLHILAEEARLNILSTPHILTSDNQGARIMVGEEVPILKETRYVSGGEEIKTYEYKDVGIELEVTPSINEEKDVSLEVMQKINKVGIYNADLKAWTFTKREARTSVVVKDGQTIVIGGLIKDDNKEIVEKIPLLGSIPYLGMLFSKREKIIEKTELMVFITPHVIFTAKEAEEITDEQKTKAKEIKEHLKKSKTKEENIRPKEVILGEGRVEEEPERTKEPAVVREEEIIDTEPIAPGPTNLKMDVKIYQDPEHIKLFVVVKNIGDEQIFVSPMSFSLLSDDGKSHQIASLSLLKEEAFRGIFLNPKKEAKGLILFEAKAPPTKLIYKDQLGNFMSFDLSLIR